MKRAKLYKGSFLISIFFFLSMAVSAYSLLMIRADLSASDFQFASITVGVTCLFGAVAIYLSTRYREEKVVYIGQKEQEVKVEKTTQVKEENNINPHAIAKILENPYDSMQTALNEICNALEAGQGAIYITNDNTLELRYGYALSLERKESVSFEFGEGLVGRVASQMEMLCLDKLPPNYMTIYSGLGAASPTFLLLAPIVKKNKVMGVLEISTFKTLSEGTMANVKRVAELLAEGMNKEKLVDYA